MAVTCWLTDSYTGGWNTSAIIPLIYYYDETEPVEEDRIKPYNRLPQSGDIFYFDGYTISNITRATINLPGVEIHNGLNPYTERTNGGLNGTGNDGVCYLNCKKIVVDGTTAFWQQGSNGGATVYINGDIHCENITSFFHKAGNGVLNLRVTGDVYRGPRGALTTADSNRAGTIIITGNYYGYNALSTSGISGSVQINGNVEMFGSRLLGQTHSSVVIYGNVTCHTNSYLSNTAQTSVIIYGNITLEGQDLFTVKATTVNFYGDKITYSNFDPLQTLFFTSDLNVYSEQLEIERTDDYGESVLISKYQLDNTDQYPAEENVKEGVKYAFETKIGTLEPIRSTNTINIYPYAKRYSV